MANKISFLVVTILLFNANIFASLCIKCHKAHYKEFKTCSICHRGIEKTSRKKIAHFGLITAKYSDFLINTNSFFKGKNLVKKTHCRRCHYVDSKGNFLAHNLNTTGANNKGEYIFTAIIKPNEFMPDFNFDNSSIIDIVKYILNVSKKKSLKKLLPYPVFISNRKENTFEKYCGNCHKIISISSGPIGKFNVGPNLSGIFTEFFIPEKKYKIKKWDNITLKKWLKNPRKIYKQALMPPIILKKKEVKELLNILN